MDRDTRTQNGLLARINRIVEVRALMGFSILFAVSVAVMYVPLFLSGKTLIRVTDGLDQHYPFFLFIGRWIRSSVTDLISGKGLPQVWDMHFGYGSDMVVTLGAYLPDPFNWLSALIPEEFSETGFVGTIMLRMWFAGFSFLTYCRYKKYGMMPSVIGALLYSTCGVTLIGPVESFFLNPLITLPLVIVGMSVVMDGGKPTMFICSLAVTFVLYFYFGYMTCILLVPAYIGEALSRGWNPSETVRRFLAFVGYSIVAVALSAVVLLPIVLVVAQTDRLGIARSLPMLYDLDYYKRVLAGFAGWASVGPDSDFGFGAVGVFAVMMLAVGRGHLSKKITLAIFTLFLLVPWFGKALNGFSYVANRWTWAYAFVVASTVVSCLPASFELGTVRRRVVYCLSGTYIAFMVYMAVSDVDAEPVNYLHLYSLIVLTVLLLSHIFLSGRSRCTAMLPIWYGICCTAVIVCSSVAATTRFTDPRISQPQLETGTALAKMTNQSPFQLLFSTAPFDGETCDWRVEKTMGLPMSQALVNGVNSYDYYISIYNNRVDRVHTLLGLNGTQLNVQYRNLDRRFGLDYAFGTRFILDDGGHPSLLGPGFEKIADSDDAHLYRSDVYRPIASLRDRVASSEEFAAASMAEREAMLAKSVVLDDGANVTKGELLADNLLSERAFRVVGSSGVQIDHNNLIVEGEDAYIDFAFNAENGRMYYVELLGCAFTPKEKGTDVHAILFHKRGKGHITSLPLRSPDDHMSGGKTDWVVNLGKFPAGEQVVRVTFSRPATYSFKGSRLVSLSESIVSEDHERSVESGDKVALRYGKNQIDCDVMASKDEVLLVTTPWSTGWSATVDGVPTEIQVADVAFMGIRVPAGEHKVVLRYRTPGLLAGAVISICGVAATFFLAKRRRTQPKEMEC